jgi:hypothetical protein
LTTTTSLPSQAAWPAGGAIGATNVLIADLPTNTGKVTDTNLGDPVIATAPDGLDRQAVLTQRLYAYGETRYYVGGVALGQQFTTEKAARAEAARRIGAGTLGALPLAPGQKTTGPTRVRVLSGSDGIVQVSRAGNNTVVELAVREEMRKGCWQVTGYIATRVAKYSVESYADSQPRTEYGYPLSSQPKNTLIRTSTGGVITDLAQAHQRTRELVTSRSLSTVSAAEAKEISDATRLPKAVSAMNGADRIKYLLQETLRQLPESAANELKAMLTSPETWAVMGAFLVAGAVPGLNTAALIVGALLLGNDALDTGGKMVEAVKSALSASTQGELVNAGKDLAQALVHSVVLVASPVIGKRVGKAINTSWKANTSAEAIAWNNYKRCLAGQKQGTVTPKQVAQAAAMFLQAKRNTANGTTPTNASSTPAPQTKPQTTQPTPATGASETPKPRNVPSAAAVKAQAAQDAIKIASEGVFTDKALQNQLGQRLTKDARTNPSKNAAVAIDPQVVQTSAMQLVMPKLLQSVFGGRSITKTAADAFKARATAWAKQDSPSNPAGALERLAGSPASQAALLRQTVVDQLTGSSAASTKALNASQPAAGRALDARRQRFAEALARSHPDAASQAQLLQQNAGNARAALLRAQAGAELGGSTPLAGAIEAQLKAKGTGERELVNLTSSPQARISVMKSALVERWQGSSGREPLLDGKSQRNLRKAIDSQLATVSGDPAKEKYLKDLAASGQTMARMVKGEPAAGNAVGKVKKQETVVSEVRAPAPELAFPSTLKSVPGGFEINVAGLTAVQRVNYLRLRSSDLSAAEINDITTRLLRSGVDGLLTHPKYLNLSVDNLACLMHLVNGLDSAVTLHDVTHILLSGPKFKYGVSEFQEAVGHTTTNQYINDPEGLFKPFQWVKGADGQAKLVIDTKGLGTVRATLASLADTATPERTAGYRFNFELNSRKQVTRAVSRVVDPSGLSGGTLKNRYAKVRTLLEQSGQLPAKVSAAFEQRLLQRYTDVETAIANYSRVELSFKEWTNAVEPMVQLLSEEAATQYQALPAATKLNLAVDGMASVLTAAGRYPDLVDIPRPDWTAKPRTDSRGIPNRFAEQWVDVETKNLNEPGYLKTYVEVRAKLRKALAPDAAP